MRILVTGAAGFIAAALALPLLAGGEVVHGIADRNRQYDLSRTTARLDRLRSREKFDFPRLDSADSAAIEQLFRKERYDAVMNLAAHAGVRYSLENPHSYIPSN